MVSRPENRPECAGNQFYTTTGRDTPFSRAGIILNFQADDVDKEHTGLTKLGLQTKMRLADHPWGDRGFSVIDPVGNQVYIYSEREPDEEFRQYYIS